MNGVVDGGWWMVNGECIITFFWPIEAKPKCQMESKSCREDNLLENMCILRTWPMANGHYTVSDNINSNHFRFNRPFIVVNAGHFSDNNIIIDTYVDDGAQFIIIQTE